MRHAYVYYRVAPAHAVAAAAQADALLRAMAPHCGPPPRRLVRCDDTSTWMEIYEDIADWPAFAAALRAAEAQTGLAALIDGDRHLECFAAP